jgi:hypothetical protein
MFRIELPPTADAAELAQKVRLSTVYWTPIPNTNPLLDPGTDQKRGPVDYHGFQSAGQGPCQHRDARGSVTGKPWS